MSNLPEPIADQHEGDNVYRLLQRSTLYHRLISDLADLFNVTLTPAIRSQAFQIVSDFVEQLDEEKYGR